MKTIQLLICSLTFAYSVSAQEYNYDNDAFKLYRGQYSVNTGFNDVTMIDDYSSKKYVAEVKNLFDKLKSSPSDVIMRQENIVISLPVISIDFMGRLYSFEIFHDLKNDYAGEICLYSTNQSFSNEYPIEAILFQYDYLINKGYITNVYLVKKNGKEVRIKLDATEMKQRLEHNLSMLNKLIETKL